MGWPFQQTLRCYWSSYTTIIFKRNQKTVQMDGLCFPLKKRAKLISTLVQSVLRSSSPSLLSHQKHSCLRKQPLNKVKGCCEQTYLCTVFLCSHDISSQSVDGLHIKHPCYVSLMQKHSLNCVLGKCEKNKGTQMLFFFL